MTSDPDSRSPRHSGGALSTRSAERARLRAGQISLGVSLMLLGAKLVAWRLTDSAAVLSDALESIVNVVAASLAVASIIVSARPPDRDHPYGHGKVEDFSAGVEGTLIVVAGVLILHQALPRIVNPRDLAHLDAGLGIVASAGIVNWLLGLFLVRTGQRTQSAALIADGKHVLTDALTTAAVIAGLGAVRVTGYTWLDPVAASLIAVTIVVAGIRIVRRSVGHLMDEADPELVDRVVTVLRAIRRPGLLAPHRLRILRTGRIQHLALHLVVPRFWSVDQAHALERGVSERIRSHMGKSTEVTVRLEPCKPSCCSFCSLADCPVRSSAFESEREWTPASASGPPPWHVPTEIR